MTNVINRNKEYLDKAFSYAKKYTTCRKVAVGSLFLDENGKEYITCNRCLDNGFNCQKEGYCFKAKETGIYKSSEETRYACKSIHSEIHMINNLLLNMDDMSKGTLFVTRYPCYSCAKYIVSKSNISNIIYGGRQKISEEVSKLFDDNNVKYKWEKECDYESDKYHPLEWWTNNFYEKAYSTIIKSGIEKFPVIIPSYNRPNFNLYNIINTMSKEYNYPILVFVRESQYNDYMNSKQSKYVTIIPLPDSEIDSAGKVRKRSLEWLYDNDYNYAFSFDDDLIGLTYTIKDWTKTGNVKASAVSNINLAKVLAMWQLSMMEADDKYDVAISGVSPMGFSWKPEYTFDDQSVLLRGSPNQAVCLNVKKLIENGINYEDNKDVGHEDIDLLIKIVDKGYNVAILPFLTYSAPAMSPENFKEFGNNMKDRFKAQQEIMYKNHSDKDWVVFREKRDLAQVVLNWIRIRKMRNVTKYIFDIWNNGKLLDN